MTPFLLYLLRASLYLAIFYAFYLLVMRRTSLFRVNRIALLAGTVICHLLPLLPLRTVIVPESIPVSLETLELVGEPVGASADGASFPWLLVVYSAGVAAILLLSLLSIARTRRIIRSGTTQPLDGCRLTLVDRDIPSFSWGRHIVMSRSDLEKYPAILAHEQQHVQKRHSLDVLLMTAVAALHWFNPLVWIARAELKLLHEYEADEGLIRKGIDATSYQLLLVRKAVGEQRFSLANGFNHAKLKQRITMMHKKPSPTRVRFAYAAVLPVLAVTMFVCNPVRARIISAPADNAPVIEAPAGQIPPTGQSIPFANVEDKPTFQGGDVNTFSKWVSQHLSYPVEAKDQGLQGRVMVQFVVGNDGAVRDVKVLRGAHELLDAEAVRVISSSPKWEPGRVDGKPVSVTYVFPVIFQLRGNEAPPITMTVGDNDNPGKISIRYTGTDAAPLVYLDGKKYEGELNYLDPSTIESMEVLKDQAAIDKYGEEAKNGVILITSKK